MQLLRVDVHVNSAQDSTAAEAVPSVWASGHDLLSIDKVVKCRGARVIGFGCPRMSFCSAWSGPLDPRGRPSGSEPAAAPAV